MKKVTFPDLRTCEQGMSCEDYSVLMIAGPGREKMPPSVEERMRQHGDLCPYHRSETFFESALDTPVTDTLEQAAQKIIKKYS